jgi:hypothetical protein
MKMNWNKGRLGHGAAISGGVLSRSRGAVCKAEEVLQSWQESAAMPCVDGSTACREKSGRLSSACIPHQSSKACTQFA